MELSTAEQTVSLVAMQ